MRDGEAERVLEELQLGRPSRSFVAALGLAELRRRVMEASIPSVWVAWRAPFPVRG